MFFQNLHFNRHSVILFSLPQTVKLAFLRIRSLLFWKNGLKVCYPLPFNLECNFQNLPTQYEQYKKHASYWRQVSVFQISPRIFDCFYIGILLDALKHSVNSSLDALPFYHRGILCSKFKLDIVFLLF